MQQIPIYIILQQHIKYAPLEEYTLGMQFSPITVILWTMLYKFQAARRLLLSRFILIYITTAY